MHKKDSRVDLYTKLVLTMIAVFLGIIAFRPVAVSPYPVSAQSERPQIYVEPGTTTIRNPDGSSQTEGKMMIDLRNGDIWGFPTLVTGSPYPVDPLNNKAPVMKPTYLGRFDISKMR